MEQVSSASGLELHRRLRPSWLHVRPRAPSHGDGVQSRGLDPGQIDRFIEHYPDFARRSEPGGGVRLVGRFERIFTADQLPDITDSFRLVVVVSERFPVVTPRVFESAGRIPESYHRLQNGAFCLGSRLRLAIAIHRQPDLVAFFEGFVVPYLYRYAHVEKFGKEPWPDLPHNAPGLLLDDSRLLGATSPEICVRFLELLALRKRLANKKPCPCGGGLRLGRCKHRAALNGLRSVRPRRWFKREANELRGALKPPSPHAPPEGSGSHSEQRPGVSRHASR